VKESGKAKLSRHRKKEIKEFEFDALLEHSLMEKRMEEDEILCFPISTTVWGRECSRKKML